MFTEYVFENRKYDVALRDVKSILFDIVMSEQEKVTAIISKVKTTGDKSLQDKLIVLCNEQGECLRNLLEISNSFSENLQMLDSYSRELKRIENKNIANIITGMRKENSNMLKKNPNNAVGAIKEQPQMAGQKPEVPNLLTPSPELAKMAGAVPGQNPSAPQMTNPASPTPNSMGQALTAPENLAKPGASLTPPGMGQAPSTMPKPAPTMPEAGTNSLLQPPGASLETKSGLSVPPSMTAPTPAMENPLEKRDNSSPATPAPNPAKEAPEMSNLLEKKEEKPIETPEKKEEAALEASSTDAKPVSDKDVEAAKQLAKSFGLNLPENIDMKSGKLTIRRKVTDGAAPAEENKEEKSEEPNKETIEKEEEEKKEEGITSTEEIKEDKVESEESSSVVKIPLVEETKETESTSKTIQLKKHSTDEAKAILTSSKQIGKLRESLETQEKELMDSGFLENTNTSKTEEVKTEEIKTEESEKTNSTPSGVIPQIIPKSTTTSSETETEEMINDTNPVKVEIPQVKAA